jgi:hypothetical protein
MGRTVWTHARLAAQGSIADRELSRLPSTIRIGPAAASSWNSRRPVAVR